MSNISNDFSDNKSEFSLVENLFEEGISYRKIPQIFYNLRKLFGASPTAQLVALNLIEISVNKRHYPNFTFKQSDVAIKTGLSDRAVSMAIKFLSSKNLLFVRPRTGLTNLYTWNDQLIRTPELASGVPLNEVQVGTCTTFRSTPEPGSCIYIEFSLDLFRSSFKGFFAEGKEYQFYVPGKRRSRSGIRNDEPQGSGSMVSVSREDAWRDAAYSAFQEVKNRKDALARVYCALRASNNIEDVKYPKSAMSFRVHDLESLAVSRSRSHLREFLYDDEDFKAYVDEQLRRRGTMDEQRSSAVHQHA